MAFARKLPFAKRWAKQTDFATLPEHKDVGTDAGAPLSGPGGLLSTPGLGSTRKRKGTKWGKRTKAVCTCGITTKAPSGAPGESLGPGITRIRGNLCNVHGRYGPCNAGQATAKPKGRKGRAARAKKPKVVHLTPEQKRAQRDAEHTQNQAKVLSSLNIAPDGQQALDALRNGQQPDPKAIARGGFEQAGLVEQAADGSYRMTASGRAALTAAQAGDAGRAGAIISAARDRTAARQARQTAAAQRQQAAATRRAQIQARRDAAARKRMQKKTKAASSSPGDYLIVEDRTKPTTWHLQVKRNGKVDHGLLGAAWAALHSGFRGNVYQGPNKGDAIAKLKKLYASEKLDTPAEKSFIVFKDASGHDRWIARTTTAYQDRDGEIISENALDQDSQRMTATKAFGPLRWWHVGDPDPAAPDAPWGPGLDIGDCDYSTVIGRTRVESGTFRDPGLAQKVAQAADGLEMSPGFFHPLDQPDAAGVFHTIRTFERSVVPTRYGQASNLFTGFTVKEFRMDSAEMEKRFKAMYTELGLTPEQGRALGDQLIATEKAAQQQGIAYKDAQYPDVVINGVTYKAAPPPPAAADAAAPTDAAPDEIPDGPDDEAAEEGEYLGDMTVADFEQMMAQMLAPVLKMQDMVKSMGDMHSELKGMYGGMATKDAGVQAEIATLKARLSELEGSQPNTVLPDEVAAALKSAGPAQAQKPDDPAKQQILNDPNRPFAWLGMQTFPELYNQNGANE